MNHVVGIIVVRKDGSVLMQHRDNKPGIFWPDYWCYLGGAVDKDEDFEETALRELREETNYISDKLFPLAEETYTRSDGQINNRHVYWTIYDEVQEIKCNEGQEIKFVKLTEFKGKKFLPGQERLFKLAIQNSKLKKNL